MSESKNTSPFIPTQFNSGDKEYELYKDFYNIFRLVYEVQDNEAYYKAVEKRLYDFTRKHIPEGRAYSDYDYHDKLVMNLSNSLAQFVQQKAEYLEQQVQNKEEEEER